MFFWCSFTQDLYNSNTSCADPWKNCPCLCVTIFFFLFSADIWSDHSFQTDPDLPPGWKKINDVAGIYYWHIPTGTTQWQRPVSIPTDLQGSRKGSLGSITPSPTPETEVTYCVFLWATYCKEN